MVSLIKPLGIALLIILLICSWGLVAGAVIAPDALQGLIEVLKVMLEGFKELIKGILEAYREYLKSIHG